MQTTARLPSRPGCPLAGRLVPDAGRLSASPGAVPGCAGRFACNSAAGNRGGVNGSWCAADGTSCRFPAPPTSPTGSSGRWTVPPSTTGVRSSPRLGQEVLAGCRAIFQTEGPVLIFPSSGTGAWEAALVNTLDPGDRVLMAETGHFATLWHTLARRLGLDPIFLPGDWRHGVDPQEIERHLAEDERHDIRAVAGGAQRDQHRGDQPHPRGAPGHRPRPPPGAADGGHHLLAGLHRLPPRRLGRRRHHRRLAEGADAPPGPGLQRRLGQGALPLPLGADDPQLLGLAGDAPPQRRRLLPLHPGHQPPLRAARVAGDAPGGGAPRRVRPPRPPRRGHPGRGARLGAGAAPPRSRRVLQLAHRGAPPRGPRRGTLPGPHPRAAGTSPSAPGWASSRAGSSASATSATSTT